MKLLLPNLYIMIKYGPLQPSKMYYLDLAFPFMNL